MAISRIGRALTNPEVELPPRPAPAPPRPSAPPPDPTGASSFADPRRNPVCLNPSEGRGRGTNDDSVGRGRGTNDDSIGRGRGTNDDSIGGAGGSTATTSRDNLDRMADSQTGRPFLNHTLADVLVPERIWQGDAPTCTVSTMQYELAQEKPAEYARLMTGLIVDGQVKLARGGTLQTQVSNAVLNSLLARDRRSPTEAVFQSAAMEFANGADDYDLRARQSVHRNEDGTTRTYKGLYGEQIREMVGQLFGIDYTTTRIENDAQAAEALATLNKSNVANRPVLVDLVVDDTTNHCVAFEGYSKGRVYFRDPQTGKKSSITEKEFLQTAAAVHVAPMSVPKPRFRTSRQLKMMEDLE